MPWTITASSLVLASALMTLGLRGRRIGDHPHCRRCGYDLFGRNDAGGRCPECGIDLSRTRSTVTGRRRRRGWAIGIALLVLVVAGGLGAVDAMNAWERIDWYRHKPDSWLLKEASRNPSPDYRALDELLRRVDEPALSASRAKRLAEGALQVQADRSIPWDRRWGYLIEALHHKRKLSVQDRGRYIRQAVVPAWDMRSRINADVPVVARISHEAQRLGRLQVVLQFTASNLRMHYWEEGRLKTEAMTDIRYAHQSGPGYMWKTARWFEAGSDLGEGEFEFQMDFDCCWRTDGKFDMQPWRDDVVEERATLTLKRPVAIAPPGSPFAYYITDPPSREAMKSALAVQVWVEQGWRVVVFHRTDLPVAFWADLSIRTPDGQVIALRPEDKRDRSHHTVTCHFQAWVAPKDLQWVDVIFTPRLKDIAESPYDKQYWGETLVLERVPTR
jgi:ribosomal protein L37E